MKTYIERFQKYLRNEQDASQNTIEAYVRDVRQFFTFEGLPEDPRDISKSHIRDYIDHMVTNLGRARSTVNRAKISLSVFFSYLVEEKIISVSPCVGIKAVKNGRSIPKNLPLSTITGILKAAEEHSLRNQLLCEMLYGSGGRVTEIVSLKVDDLDFESKFIHLFGKGRKDRMNPIHDRCLRLAKEWMKQENITDGYLFPSPKKPGSAITRRAVQDIVKAMAVDAGVDPDKVSPHVFRHSYASHLMERGSDLASVQELLGHEDIETTRIYAQITKAQKQRTFENFHPLADSV